MTDTDIQRSLGRVEGKLDMVLVRLSDLEDAQKKGHVCVNSERIKKLEAKTEVLQVEESKRKGARAFVTLLISILGGVIGALSYLHGKG